MPFEDLKDSKVLITKIEREPPLPISINFFYPEETPAFMQRVFVKAIAPGSGSY
jgi:hypothetical protein